MHPVDFTHWRLEPRTLQLTGPTFSARVEARPHAWRILVYQRPQDAEKSSWAVASTQRRPLTFDGRTARAPNLPPLELTLAPFAFTFAELSATGLLAHEQATWRTAAAAALDPLKPTQPEPPTDGYPLGGGLELRLAERPARRYFGLGERTGFLDKKGRRYTHWNTDALDHHETTDPLYQAHPFLIGVEDGRAWGVFLDETWPSVFDLAATTPHQSALFTPGPTLDLYLIPGPTVREVVAGFTGLTGTPPLPPLWALGFHQCRWGYPDAGSVRAVADAFATHDIPLSALWLDIDHMDGYRVFTFHPARFPEPERLIGALRERGVRTVVIVDPGVKKEAGYPVYEDGKRLRAFVETPRGDEVVGEVWANPAVWPDFTRPEVRAWWADLHRYYLEKGVAGIWNDMNEPSAFRIEGTPPQQTGKTLPLGARHGKASHAEVHNVYGLAMSQAAHEAQRRAAPTRRPFVLTRAGFAGIQRYAWVWTGDNQSHWSHLEMSIPMLLNLSLSGVAFAGADIGGFSEDATPELVTRWTWLGAFYPLMRNHSSKTSRRQEPYAFGAPWTHPMRQAIRFRYQLLPYTYTLAEEAHRTGAPLMRPLFYEFPEDETAYTLHDAFLYGPALLVAPITRPAQTHRAVYLPPGRWQDWWTGEVLEGPRWIVAEAPLDAIPLYLREGHAVPTTTPEPRETARFDPLVFRAFPTGPSRGEVYEDDGDGPTPGRRSRLEVHDRTARFDGPRAGRTVRVEVLTPEGERAALELAPP
ncbi:TIM-barrel domain-containing protein [Marinithermus hydrothermalis]|uniref:Alpha-glucosidase n=1 Tax=Marinithermus hydrothermalis (strain DSM 14884 / JCM 11576 / T1) TaxID=869210 RepID=F2NQX3_MARHT|nr:TIM-barrel domain-containing protein [Marinithermus hydrothermalis]AEB12551.1 Alpha-glucosidase [Marinithermus hydrothermalis DSM 14884]